VKTGRRARVAIIFILYSRYLETCARYVKRWVCTVMSVWQHRQANKVGPEWHSDQLIPGIWTPLAECAACIWPFPAAIPFLRRTQQTPTETQIRPGSDMLRSGHAQEQPRGAEHAPAHDWPFIGDPASSATRSQQGHVGIRDSGSKVAALAPRPLAHRTLPHPGRPPSTQFAKVTGG
jgi:hypothetical protein